MKWWFVLLSAALGFGLSWFLIVRARRTAAAAVPAAAVEPIVADEAPEDAAAVRDDEPDDDETDDGETEDGDATAFGGEATADVSAWVADDAPSSHWQADTIDEDAVLHQVDEGTDDEPALPEQTEPELVVPPLADSGSGDLAGVAAEPHEAAADEEPTDESVTDPGSAEPADLDGELEVPPVEGTVSGNGDLAGVTPEPQGPGDAEAGATAEEPDTEPGNEVDAQDGDSRRP